MASRDIKQCVPELQEKFAQFESKVREAGLSIAITCTSRSYLEQLALHAQGRENLEMVNHLRANAGMPPITDEENKHCVTWTLDSKHIINDKRKLSEAVDIVLLNHGKADYDIKADINGDHIPDYITLAQIGREVGLHPGADFPKPDYPHFEV